MSRFTAFISRLVRGSGAHNTVNIPTARVIFQRAPGLATGNDRGIQGLAYRVMAGGVAIQNGTTPADGAIDVRVPSGGSTLELLVNGSPVASYAVRIRSAAAEAATGIDGQQRRLRMLGYHIGTTGADRVGVDNTMNVKTDRAILQFQADQQIETDGIVGSTTRGRLTTDAGV